MEEDIVGDMPIGRAGIAKLQKEGLEIPEGEKFIFYLMEWIGKGNAAVLRMVGQNYRQATRGKNKGKFTVKVDSTQRQVFLTRAEINEHNEVSQ